MPPSSDRKMTFLAMMDRVYVLFLLPKAIKSDRGDASSITISFSMTAARSEIPSLFKSPLAMAFSPRTGSKMCHPAGISALMLSALATGFGVWVEAALPQQFEYEKDQYTPLCSLKGQQYLRTLLLVFSSSLLPSHVLRGFFPHDAYIPTQYIE